MTPTQALVPCKCLDLEDPTSPVFMPQREVVEDWPDSTPVRLYYDNCYACHSKDCSQKCSRCHLVGYCSQACQKTHWEGHHKQFCGKQPSWWGKWPEE
jgi:hypothetical protein